MPPKAADVATDSKDLTINALGNIILQQESHKIDTNALAAIFGLTHGKNVPRKLNGLLEPYGWKCEHSKLVKSNNNNPNAAVDTTTPANTDDSTKDDQEASDDKSVMTPVTPKTPKTQKARKPAAKTSANGKKRASPGGDEDGDDNEATAENLTPKKAKPTPKPTPKPAKGKAVEAKPEPEAKEDEVMDEAAVSDTET